MSIKAYIKSSMDIVFADSQIKEDSFSEIKALSNQPVSFQLAYVFENDDEHMIYKTRNLKVEIESEIKDYINLYYVNTVPATMIE